MPLFTYTQRGTDIPKATLEPQHPETDSKLDSKVSMLDKLDF